MNKLRGWKTYLFNALLVVSAGVSYIEQNNSVVTDFFNDPVKVKLGLFVIGLVGITLRTATRTPPFTSEEVK